MELFSGTPQDLLAVACPASPESSLSLPKRVQRRRCSCGGCRQCRENARWEKVFNEKFADPSYYDRYSLRFSSPLSEVAG